MLRWGLKLQKETKNVSVVSDVFQTTMLHLVFFLTNINQTCKVVVSDLTQTTMLHFGVNL